MKNHFQKTGLLACCLLIACGTFMHAAGQGTRVPALAAPLDFTLLLSGNYGEIRSTHFHTGLDFKTEQVEGKHVRSVLDGQVIRIKVQSSGYGKAIYIQHEGGLVTVYGHLSLYMPEVENYVKDNQYRLKSYEVDLFPEAGRFVYKKGQQIGYSGNTGNSSGPHLHFEIRDAATSVPLNVLNFGLPVRDKTPPKIYWLGVYPLGKDSRINGRNEKYITQVIPRNGNYMIRDTSIQLTGDIGFGIETYDYLDGSSNACSPLTTLLAVDGDTLCLYTLDSIPFDMALTVNSHIDYEEKLKTGKVIQKLYQDPNNPLKIYKVAPGRGVFRFDDLSAHRIFVSVTDAYGNNSVLDFNVRSVPPDQVTPGTVPDSSGLVTFNYDSLNVFESEGVRLVVPRNALFRNIEFTYARLTAPEESLSDTFAIHNEYDPLFKSIILSIRPKHLADGTYDKVFMARTGNNGKYIPAGGSFGNGYVTAQVSSFGKYFLVVDTAGPQITPVSFRGGGQYQEGETISFRITDDESGIGGYTGHIDGKWALFEYDAKNNLIFYSMDKERLEKGRSHRLEIMVTDERNNMSHFISSFFY